MKAIDKFNQSKTWQSRSRVICIFHLRQIARNPKWNMRLTARYFRISLGSVSEAMLLVKHFKLVNSLESRNKALKLIRGKYGHPIASKETS